MLSGIEFDRPVFPAAQQIHRRYPGERTQFQMCRRSALEKEGFHRIQRRFGQLLEDPEAEALRSRRIRAVENHVSPATFHPVRTAFGKQPPPRHRELHARIPLCRFQPPRESKIARNHSRRGHLPVVAAL